MSDAGAKGQHGDKMFGALQYNTAIFDACTVERMAGHFQTLLEAAVEAAETPVAVLPLMSRVEQVEVALDWNNTTALYGPFTEGLCVHEMFEEQVRVSTQCFSTLRAMLRVTQCYSYKYTVQIYTKSYTNTNALPSPPPSSNSFLIPRYIYRDICQYNYVHIVLLW